MGPFVTTRVLLPGRSFGPGTVSARILTVARVYLSPTGEDATVGMEARVRMIFPADDSPCLVEYCSRSAMMIDLRGAGRSIPIQAPLRSFGPWRVKERAT